ncbi:Retrovirus-related Pol polyprotein from transposon TNT 1-94 [Trichinella spiralis]|uniref:Retrovirus-related Pol polyprotein from transposon TNT 1-94 n=1 Tax=Trichinella spiralis TaxID=6334 RepID=A0ABR3K6A4_TRISP
MFRVFDDTNKHRVDKVTDVKFNESLQKRLVLIDGEEDSWMQTADKDEDDFLEEDITDDKTEKRGPGRPSGSRNKIKVISNPRKMELRSKSTDRTAMLAAADPLTEEEALEGANAEKWKEAILEEISALHMNNTWILTDLPADRKTVQSADEDLEILQFDVKTAFLHGKIDEIIFMEQPPCFNDGSGRVCKLQRALYGLKQAPRAWNKRLNDFLLTLNLQRAAADSCLYVSAPGAECRIILRLYVDDGLLCCWSLTVLKELVKKLDAEFEITIGVPSNFVGLEIYRDRSKSTIAIGQKNYIKRVLLKFKMGSCKDKIGIPSMENQHQLIAFCDSDWAGDADNRRSTVGYIMTFCNGPVAWSSRVQKTIALSTHDRRRSVEAEYMALTEGVKEVKWIRQLLMDLGRNQVIPTLLFSDNQGAAFLTKNPQHHRWTKHIDIRYHFIRTEQEQGVVSVEYTPSDKQPADMLTYLLSDPRH